MALDLLDDLVVELHVHVMPGHDGDEVRAAATSLADVGAGLDAEFFGFVTGGDGAGGVGVHRNDGDGLATESGVELLLHAGKVAIEIEKQPVHAGGRSRRGSHKRMAVSL